MNSEKFTLSTADFIILAVMLVVSAGIGVFFQLTSKKKTNEEYLLAGKDMSILPVAFSLFATFMSATTLMGIPAEMYLYGTNMAFMNIGFIIGPIITSYVFLPIYFANDVSTTYEREFGHEGNLGDKLEIDEEGILTHPVSQKIDIDMKISLLVMLKMHIIYLHFRKNSTDILKDIKDFLKYPKLSRTFLAYNMQTRCLQINGQYL
ncbi:Sodium-coupled monocarboxylate transporter 2 [Araneus ventricosus]|uniref:Sodium-coupled monocarboxylate transporter 2 n=1 Tax=Araneus ventricosus TaxID=182803 RepID=A0A4Y2RDB4_ARAVE|nr:Sodium-coupled monocarboxylate transporter 2 [Araneus ventricosus]